MDIPSHINLTDVQAILLTDGWHPIEGLRYAQTGDDYDDPTHFIAYELIDPHNDDLPTEYISGPITSILAMRS